jgi:hypothetical protein
LQDGALPTLATLDQSKVCIIETPVSMYAYQKEFVSEALRPVFFSRRMVFFELGRSVAHWRLFERDASRYLFAIF